MEILDNKKQNKIKTNASPIMFGKYDLNGIQEKTRKPWIICKPVYTKHFKVPLIQFRMCFEPW